MDLGSHRPRGRPRRDYARRRRRLRDDHRALDRHRPWVTPRLESDELDITFEPPSVSLYDATTRVPIEVAVRGDVTRDFTPIVTFDVKACDPAFSDQSFRHLPQRSLSSHSTAAELAFRRMPSRSTGGSSMLSPSLAGSPPRRSASTASARSARLFLGPRSLGAEQ